MSRRTFYRGTFEICAGFDVQLQHFFLDIYDHAPLNTGCEDRIVYSSLDERPDVYGNFGLMDIDAGMKAQEIMPPLRFLKDLREDAQANVGTLDVTYEEDTDATL